jgi:hypothetical protein
MDRCEKDSTRQEPRLEMCRPVLPTFITATLARVRRVTGDEQQTKEWRGQEQ